MNSQSDFDFVLVKHEHSMNTKIIPMYLIFLQQMTSLLSVVMVMVSGTKDSERFT